MNIFNFDNIPNNITNYTTEERCSNCGECCSRFLPMSSKEEKEIIRFCKKNNISFPFLGTPLNYQNHLYMRCPFRNDSNKICMIYKVRPSICKQFICSQPEQAIKIKENYYRKFEIIDMFDIVEKCMKK